MGDLASAQSVKIETSQAVKDSELYRRVSELVAERSDKILALTGPRAGRDDKAIKEELGKVLGVDPSALKLSVPVTHPETKSFVVEARVDDSMVRLSLAPVADGKLELQGLQLGPNSLLRHGLAIPLEQLTDLVLPKAPIDGILPHRTDPGLGHLVPVFSEISTNPIYKGSEYSGNALLRTELAAFTSRTLHAQGLQPTPENIEKAVGLIADTQKSLANLPLFEGRAVLSVAHSESVYEMPSSPGSAGAGKAAYDYVSRGQDEHRFGRARYQDSIRLLAGAGVNPEFLRAERPTEMAAMRVRNALQLNGDFFRAWNEKTLPEEVKPELGKMLASLLESKEQDVDFKYTPPTDLKDPTKAKGSFEVSVKGEKILMGSLTFAENGTLSRVDMENLKSDPEGYLEELKRVKAETLEKIASTKPGPNGFTFVFAGHGNANVVALTGGVPQQTPTGLRIVMPNEGVISANELADAIIKRHDNHPAKSDKPDLYVISACVSGDYVETVQKRVAEAGVPPVVLISQTEFNLLGHSTGINPIGNEFIEQLLMPYEPEKPKTGYEDAAAEDIMVQGHTKEPWNPEQVKKSPTLGDLIKAMQKDPQYPGSNPRILAPARSTKPEAEQPKWLQISGMERKTWPLS